MEHRFVMKDPETPQFEGESENDILNSEISDAEPIQTIDVEVFSNQNNKSIQPGAYYALTVLTLINFINYMDRYIPSANKELIKVLVKKTVIITGSQGRLKFNRHGDFTSHYCLHRRVHARISHFWCFGR